ncbi:hypothetical protein JCM19235_287 [Vibrio maritimus]|uniref:Uncharacterized protein n=2 Tax=Vibrio TaxID=662 RepID=A0A090SNR9_9VIBR|nr:hypothetical protein JCM19235_287 [Vibrio maritimus]GAL30726.1 hypothetical protein JCM19239_4465 [Vibrio variabilis]
MVVITTFAIGLLNNRNESTVAALLWFVTNRPKYHRSLQI